MLACLILFVYIGYNYNAIESAILQLRLDGT